MTRTVIVDIRGNSFPEQTVEPDTYVVWRNLDPVPHTVETDPESSYYFNVGPLPTGEISSPVWFSREGKFEYVCRFHHEMTGEVTVAAGAHAEAHPMPAHSGHDGLAHFHGFITGGRSGSRLYMSHTPVIADDRHRYQVILRGSFADPKHAAIYEALRSTSYGSGKTQIFHDHLALPDIGAGKIALLPEASVQYYPPDHPGGIEIPGLEEKIPVKIDKILHFHQFDPDASYPVGLQYLVYGDDLDVFIDHHIIGAPSFHSVAKLSGQPDFWTPDNFDGTSSILIPEKRIVDVSPKVLRRVAFVDNSYHLAWLPPSGAYRQPPPDPLIRRDGTAPQYDVLVAGTRPSHIVVERFIHFDVALLNNRVVIT
ncbi:cupredoxin domain-containing protein [Mesorhizobium australicum]|uniref:cupredoxin domain-containing protein n=1 Tax=Mesorhizobium australicum TaxID=536018 RepID=UPI003335B07D